MMVLGGAYMSFESAMLAVLICGWTVGEAMLVERAVVLRFLFSMPG